MKINKIIILNSEAHERVELELDSDSLQIAGRNNRGKTSILNTLPFLFIVDRNRIKSDYGSKETLHFYFPSQDKSYIIFEGYDYQKGYFYLLLKRKNDIIEYYYSNKAFSIDYLIENGEFLSFDKVKANYFKNGLETKPLKNTLEILSVAFGTKEDKNNRMSFLKLDKKSSDFRKFGDLYMNLFTTKTISGDLLKDGILISTNNKNTYIDYADDNNENLIRWKKLNREIEKLLPYKEKQSNLLEIKSNIELNYQISKGAFGVLEHFLKDFKLINSEIVDLEEKIKNLTTEFISLEAEHEDLNKDLIVKNKDKENLEKELKDRRLIIEKIESYDPADWLNQIISEKEKLRFQKEDLLSKIETQDDIQTVKNKLSTLTQKLIKIENGIENNQNLLIHNISNNLEDKKRLNSIFSNEVLNLDKQIIKKDSISLIDFKNFKIADMVLDLSTIEPSNILSIEELKQKKESHENEIKELKKLLDNVNERDSIKREIKELNDDIFKLKERIEEIKNLPKLLEKQKDDNEKYARYEPLLKELDKQIGINKASQKKTKELIEKTNKMLEKYKSLIELLQKVGTIVNSYKSTFNTTPKESISKYKNDVDSYSKELGDYLEEFEKKYLEYEDSRKKYQDKIEQARRELSDTEGGALSNEEEFLKWLNESINQLDDKEKRQIETRKATESIFYEKNKQILDGLDEVKKYIQNEINREIADYKISNLTNVKLIFKENTNLTKMLRYATEQGLNLIDMMNDDFMPNIHEESELYQYIKKGKKIYLHELFEIKPEYDSDEKKMTKKQSNGTEKLIKVIVLLLFMRKMIREDCTITFPIDELADIDLANQKQLFSFLKSNNMQPISASPITSPLIEKIYLLKENKKNKAVLTNKTLTRKKWNKDESENT